MQRFSTCLILAGGMCATVPTAFASPSPLTACASHTPPFVLMQNEIGVGGFSVELVQFVARTLKRSADIKDLPWARCLNEVQAGRIDIAIDAYDDVERRNKFRYSIPYYELTPQVFYRKGTFVNVIPATSVTSLIALKGCGLREYTYEHYDLEAKSLDRGAADDLQLLKKLKAGYCDYGIEELEFVIGGRMYQTGWPDESDLASFRPAWARGPSLHFLVGNSHHSAPKLQAAINAAIEQARKSGVIRQLRNRYLDASRKPNLAK